MAKDFIRNVVARRLLEDDGTVKKAEFHDLVRPVEEQFATQVLGLQYNPSDIGSFLTALGVPVAAGATTRRQTAPAALGQRGDRFSADLGRARGEADAGDFDFGLDRGRDPSDAPEGYVPRGDLGDPAVAEAFDKALENVEVEEVGSTFGSLAFGPLGGVLGGLLGGLIDSATEGPE